MTPEDSDILSLEMVTERCCTEAVSVIRDGYFSYTALFPNAHSIPRKKLSILTKYERQNNTCNLLISQAVSDGSSSVYV